MAIAAVRSPEQVVLNTPDGRRLAIQVWPGTGAPLVFLHGLLACAEEWREQSLASRRPCFAFDLPGFGGSQLPARPRISAYAEDVVWAMEQLELSGVVLVGHSLGGAIATAVAEQVPGRVAALLLLAPAGFGRIHLAEAVSIPGFRSLVAATLPFALGNQVVLTAAYMGFVTPGRAPSPELLARVIAGAGEATPGAREGTHAVVAAGLSSSGFHRRRVAYEGPVTAVWGSRDRVVSPSHAAGLRRGLPQADISFWNGMGHHPQYERPVALAELIEAVAAGSAPVAVRPVVAGSAPVLARPVARAPAVAARSTLPR